MYKTLRSLLLAASLLCGASLSAQNLAWAPILGDGMVLQQSTDAHLWGTAPARAQVSISASWLTSPVTVKADAKGKWSAMVPTPAASFEAQTITASADGKSISASNVLIGEVWFCSGQSNMEMTLSGGRGNPVQGSLHETAMSSRYKGVRYMTVKKASPAEPAEEAEGEWQLCNPNNVPGWGAVAYFFASRLSEALDVPVGIINASWGGSVIEAWMSRDLLKDCPDVDFATISDSKTNAMYKPTVMYNGMLKPASKYTVNGIVWYQGESNISIAYKEYADRLTAMAALWRKDFGRGDIPFFIVELPPYDYYDGNYGLQDEHGPIVREQQFIASQRIPNAAIIGTNDLTLPYEQFQVHPSVKLPIGERLCYMAMAKAYGYDSLPALNPSFKSLEIQGNKVIVSFDNAQMGFMGTTEIKGFEVCGGGKHFHPAKAEVNMGRNITVTVWSDMVPEPTAVRYCFKDFEVGTLKGANGLPVIPFRTDVDSE